MLMSFCHNCQQVLLSHFHFLHGYRRCYPSSLYFVAGCYNQKLRMSTPERQKLFLVNLRAEIYRLIISCTWNVNVYGSKYMKMTICAYMPYNKYMIWKSQNEWLRLKGPAHPALNFELRVKDLLNIVAEHFIRRPSCNLIHGWQLLRMSMFSIRPIWKRKQAFIHADQLVWVRCLGSPMTLIVFCQTVCSWQCTSWLQLSRTFCDCFQESAICSI